jgi:hypothetical protein
MTFKCLIYRSATIAIFQRMSFFQKNAKYDGGFRATTPVIVNLWRIVQQELTAEQQRKFLHFITSCERTPVGGMKTVKIIIQRNGPDSDQLPTAHTCFNILMLPEYRSKDKLKTKLLTALQFSEGFGLL